MRTGWSVLIVVTLYACYFSNLDAVGFVGPDEPRYAWIARDMAETGDWITPRLYGRPWFEKPPLLYWSAAIFFRMLPNRPEIAARLPSAISALLATLALAWLAWRIYGPERARWLLVLLPTSFGMVGFSHACATDMPFAATLTVALVGAAAVLDLGPAGDARPPLPRASWLAPLFFGFFLGLAVLAKGPAALILMGGAVFFWALFTKRWREALRLLHPAALAVFLLTALPWYILCARRNPDFFRVFFIEHNFRRFLTPEFQHTQPVWFYLPVLATALAPWVAVGVAGLIRQAASFLRSRAASPIALLLCSWTTFCFLFFSLSRSKLPGYLLPAVPAAVLAMSGWYSADTVLSRRAKGLLLAATSIAFFAAFAFSSYRLRHPVRLDAPPLADAQSHAMLMVTLFLGLATFLCAASFAAGKRSTVEFPLLASGILALTFLTSSAKSLAEYTRLDLASGKALVRAAAEAGGAQLRLAGFRRDYRYSLSFYLHREIIDWSDGPIQNGFVLSNGVSCSQLHTLEGCRPKPAEEPLPVGDWALLEITPADSLDGTQGRRQFQ